MPFEPFSASAGPIGGLGGEAQPGHMINEGSEFSPLFSTVDSLVAGLENTGSDNTWLPYNRMIQAPTINSGADVPYGVYLWQQDKILDQNPADNEWRLAHTVTGQENLLDYGIKSGFRYLIGTDGRPYLAGIYPGSGANEVGLVKFDILTDTWSSQVFEVGGKFTNCTYATVHDGQLWMHTEGALYIADPAGNSVYRQANPAQIGSDWRDKVFVLRGRVFISSIAGSLNRVYEYFGAFKLMSALSAARAGSQSEFGVLYDLDSAYAMYYDNVGQKRAFQIQVSSGDPFDSLTITDRSLTVFGTTMTPPATENRIICYQNQQTDPTSAYVGYMVVQERTIPPTTFRYGDAWSVLRFTGPLNLVTTVGLGPSGGTTYCSAPKGGGVWSRSSPVNIDKVAVRVFGFRELDPPPMGVPEGALEVKFGVFGATGAPSTQALRLLFAVDDDVESDYDTGIAHVQGTIFSSSQGSLDGSGRLSGVPVTANSGLQGANYYTLVWDRVADGVDPTKRHHLKLETKNSSIEFL